MFSNRSVCLLVCMSSELQNNNWPDFHITWWNSVAWADKSPLHFDLNHGTDIQIIFALTLRATVFVLHSSGVGIIGKMSS